MKLEEAIKSTQFNSEKHKAGLNVLYTAWWLKTLTTKELKKYGLTMEQYNVLRILKGKYPDQMCVRDIAGRMIERSSNVPRIIDRLEIKKMVKRSTSMADKRETVITITEVGLNILKITTKDMNEVFEKALGCSEQQAAELNSLLEAFRQND